MKVEFIREKEFIQETWKDENKRGQMVTIYKGDIFETGLWGRSESVLTNKGEWICDIDCKEFNELFRVVS